MKKIIFSFETLYISDTNKPSQGQDLIQAPKVHAFFNLSAYRYELHLVCYGL